MSNFNLPKPDKKKWGLGDINSILPDINNISIGGSGSGGSGQIGSGGTIGDETYKWKLLHDTNYYNVITNQIDSRDNNITKTPYYYNNRYEWEEIVVDLSENDESKYTYAEIVRALQNDGTQIKYLTNQTPELCAIAIAQNPIALAFVVQQTPGLCRMAVRMDPSILNVVTEQTYDLIMEALKINPHAYKFIDKNKFPDLYKYGKLKTY